MKEKKISLLSDTHIMNLAINQLSRNSNLEMTIWVQTLNKRTHNKDKFKLMRILIQCKHELGSLSQLRENETLKCIELEQLVKRFEEFERLKLTVLIWMECVKFKLLDQLEMKHIYKDQWLRANMKGIYLEVQRKVHRKEIWELD